MIGKTFIAVLAIILTLVAYRAGLFVFRKSRMPLFNPLLIAVLLVMAALHVTHISYAAYNLGGHLISALLMPATVALALPLYRELPLLRRNALAIFAAVSAGALTAFAAVLACAVLFGFSALLTRSLMPKSITTPLGIIVSTQLGGVPSITVAAILLSGMLGAMFAPGLARALRIRDPLARGLAMGTASHAIGTARALELAPTEGALSALAMALCGLLTVFLAPLAWRLFTILAPHLGIALK